MNFLSIFWVLLLCIGIYMIIGLILVGFLYIYVPDNIIKKHLSGKGFMPILKATLYGIPLPICSCGMIPMATALKKSGASNAAVTSFFITTPMTGVDSIIATYGVFGWPMALLRVLSSLISGIVAGFFVDLIKEEKKKKTSFKWTVSPQIHDDSSCQSCCSHHENHNKNYPKWKKAFDYSLNEVFRDVARPILIGLILSTFLMMLLPADFMSELKGELLISYALVIIISLPIYVCSSSTIPLAFTMLFLGIAPGAVFVFLSLAPTTNIITASIYKKLLGFKALIIYLVVIVIVNLAFGLTIDFILPRGLFIPHAFVGQEGYSLISKISAVIFFILLVYYSIPLPKRFKILSRN